MSRRSAPSATARWCAGQTAWVHPSLCTSGTTLPRTGAPGSSTSGAFSCTGNRPGSACFGRLPRDTCRRADGPSLADTPGGRHDRMRVGSLQSHARLSIAQQVACRRPPAGGHEGPRAPFASVRALRPPGRPRRSQPEDAGNAGNRTQAEVGGRRRPHHRILTAAGLDLRRVVAGGTTYRCWQAHGVRPPLSADDRAVAETWCLQFFFASSL